MPTRIFSQLAGVKHETSWRLKLVGWWHIVYGVMAIFTVLQMTVIGSMFSELNLPGLNRGLLSLVAFAGLTLGSVTAYSGLMVLDRSRMAGVLLLIRSASGLSLVFVASPFSLLSLLLQVAGIILIASIWNELEGPLPFGFKSMRSVLIGVVAVFAVGLLRQSSPKVQKPRYRTVVYSAPVTVIRASHQDSTTR